MNKLIALWVAFAKEKEIEEYGSDVQKLYDYTMNLQQENQQLKNNWDELKRWVYEDHYLGIDLVRDNSTYTGVFKKMLELEQGVSDVED